MPRIGLVAGYGKLPLIFAQAAKEKGETVIGFGLKGVTDENLAGCVDRMHWLEWGGFKKALLLIAAERIKRIVMLGKIKKDVFFKGDEEFDDKARKILEETKDRKDYSILSEISKVLKTFGIEVMDPTGYLKELMPSKGVLTKREPTKDEWGDIDYGKLVAKDLSRYDIGQTIAVKDKTVIALEAVEGTDEMIRRAGRLARAGFVVVKVARPHQDMKFDIPLIGPDTLNALIEAKGKALALEGERTLLMDKSELVKIADENSISVVVI